MDERALEEERLMKPLEPYRPETWLMTERRMQLRDCECGKQVRADRLYPEAGVRSHQQTREHRAWREAMGL